MVRLDVIRRSLVKRCIWILTVGLLWALPACENPDQNKSASPEVRNEEPMPLDAMDTPTSEPRYTQPPSNPPPRTADASEDTYDEVVVPRKSTGTKSAAPKRSASGGGARTYVVKKGDTLSSIAKKMYGSENQYRKILNANRKTIKDPNKLRVGQKLIIP